MSGGTLQHSTQLALGQVAECFDIDAGEHEEEVHVSDDADWWQGVEEAMTADDSNHGFFAHSPSIVDLTDPKVVAPRRRIRNKRPASPDMQGARPKKIRRPG